MRRIALVLLLAAGCASTPRGDVRDAMSAFLSALNRLDAAAINAWFAEDATAFFPTAKAERLDGKPSIAAVFDQYVEATKKNVAGTNIVAEDLRVQEAGNVAVVTFNVHNPSAVSRRTFVWRWSAGAWRIVHMHASNTKH